MRNIVFKIMMLAGMLAVSSVRASTLYVDAAGTNPVPPYGSWQSAATNIQDAVDAAASGAVVMVTNGHYFLSAEILVNDNITVQSVNGPEVTVVDGGGSNRCFNLQSSDILVSGFTITNGYLFFTSEAGAGVYCQYETCVVSNCTISGNSARYEGGGMYGGTASNCTISDNNARDFEGKGGGMYGGVAYSCTINGNSAAYGGGLYGGIAYNCLISGNSAGYGGGMAGGTAYNCTISGNSASSGGGTSRCSAYNCTISGNFALSFTFGGAMTDYGGGGMYGGTANNCTISGNTAFTWGGGMLLGIATNCTIIGNSATLGGGMSYGTANNCIIWHNTASSGYFANLRYTTANWSCSPDAVHGVNGNITNAPILVSATHIAADSPCRGAGSALYASGMDWDGEAWLVPPSMGCDEIHEPVAGEIELSILGPARIRAGFSAKYTAEIRGPITGYWLDFGDGTVVTNAIRPTSHAWSTPGTWEMVLTAFNADHPGGVSLTQNVEVVSAAGSTIHVANATGNDANDGLSWSSAKRNIQAGVEAQALYGGLVLVSNGTYTAGSIYSTIDKTVAVQSLNGPDVTLLDGGGVGRGFTLLANDIIISGFTITNGYAGSGAGVYCRYPTCVISNCTITGNSARYSGGGMLSGTAYNCTISNNFSRYSGGGIYDGRAYNCTISGNSARYEGGGIRGLWDGVIAASNCTINGNSARSGGGMYGGTAYNCLISGNSATNFGGGMEYGTAYNCTISGNSASEGGGIYWGSAYNCIVWNNEALSSFDLHLHDMLTVSHTCSPDAAHGVDGNITNAPMFIDPGNGDFSLLAISPCIDAGSNGVVSTSTDLTGNPRIVDGDLDGIATVDMGAYEFNMQEILIECRAINRKSKGRISVAVITTDDIDASTIDPSSVRFAGAAPVHFTRTDVNGDGAIDLKLHFKTGDLAIADDGEVTLVGQTYGGVLVVGSDTARLIH